MSRRFHRNNMANSMRAGLRMRIQKQEEAKRARELRRLAGAYDQIEEEEEDVVGEAPVMGSVEPEVGFVLEEEGTDEEMADDEVGAEGIEEEIDVA